MWTARLLNTVIALLLIGACGLLSSCASTTAPAYLAECPRLDQPDPRLMEPPLGFQPLPEIDLSDRDALPDMVRNNQACEQNRSRYEELQRWIRGRAMNLTPEQFKSLFPGADPAILGYLNRAMVRYDVVSTVRMAAFLSQVGHESTGLRRAVENLNYSADGLAATWPKRYRAADGKPNALARDLHRNPEAIANNVYANRMGNGSEASGEGWRYRGRGYIQTTGKRNYAIAGTGLGLPLLAHPELLESPEHACNSAGFFWYTHGCNELADRGEFVTTTEVINGGLAGLPDRLRRWKLAQEALYG